MSKMAKCIARRFTLVELLMVFAIFAVLIAMLIPSLSRARGYAKEVACMDNVRQIALGYRNYAHDYNNQMPFATSPGSSPTCYYFLDDFTPVYPFVSKSVKIFKCPASKSSITSYSDLVSRKADYLCGGSFLDMELKNQKNNGHGNNVYSFDPSNPGNPTQTALYDKMVDPDNLRRNCNQRAIYERCYKWHLSGRSIFVASIDDLHCFKDTKSVRPYWMLDSSGKVVTGQVSWPNLGNWPPP